MRTINATRQLRLNRAVTTEALCILITLQNTTVIALTDHNKKITNNGIDYLPEESFFPSKIEGSNSMQDNSKMDFAGIISTVITKLDLHSGVWDGAQIKILYIDYMRPDLTAIIIKQGKIGKVSVSDSGFTCEFLGLKDYFRQKIGRNLIPSCDAQFGDSRCGKDLTELNNKQTGTVLSSVTNITIVSNDIATTTHTSTNENNNFYNFGWIQWTSGNNNGRISNIKLHTFATGEHTFTFFLPTNFNIQNGDSFDIVSGCDKAWSTCRERHSNNRFTGFPYLPGNTLYSN